MKTHIIQYLREFWSPGKITAFFLLLTSWVIHKLHPLYFMHCSRIKSSEQIVSCSEPFKETIIGSLSQAGLEFSLFFLILLLLPLSLLHTWLKHIASWSIPLGVLLYLGGGDGSGGIPAGGFTHAAMLEAAVRGWIYLLIGFIIFSFGRWLRRHWQQKNS